MPGRLTSANHRYLSSKPPPTAYGGGVSGPTLFFAETTNILFSRWPRALIQHEDFQSKYAVKLLKRYRKDHLMFNDDIQGTAATVLAGLYGALKVQGKKPEQLKVNTAE